MTPKERFERALRREEVDRLPFWVKIFGASYIHFQPDVYRQMPGLELAEYLDLDHLSGCPAPVQVKNDRASVRSERQNGTRVTLIETPDGTLRGVEGFDEGSHSWHPIEFPVKTREDIKVLRHRYDGNEYAVAPELVQRGKETIESLGDRGIVTTGMGISPLMDLIQHLIGPDHTYFFLADYPQEMDELIELMHRDSLNRLRIIAEHAPCDYIVSVENTSTTLLSPQVFEKYCWRHLNEYGQVVKEQGKHHMMHMCGKLLELLPKIDELPADSIEAYTSPPLGNTTIADRANLCPSKAIIGGTDATLWMRPADEICPEIERSLEEAGGMRGVVLTSAGVMPPAATIEKIKQVREFAKGLRWDRYGNGGC
ncbi:MAG: uroporphyrinogen decarboxylase family protein [Armatimonadota bacterium]